MPYSIRQHLFPLLIIIHLHRSANHVHDLFSAFHFVYLTFCFMLITFHVIYFISSCPSWGSGIMMNAFPTSERPGDFALRKLYQALSDAQNNTIIACLKSEWQKPGKATSTTRVIKINSEAFLKYSPLKPNKKSWGSIRTWDREAKLTNKWSL